MHNSYGDIFRITSFGESHGKVIGIVIDGCPSGLEITAKEIQKDLNRRRPGTSDIVTSRFEDDVIEILSGIKANRTTGAPITIIIKNVNFDSTPYKKIKKTPRPSHADYPALVRYGKWVDLNGGGRFSGRVTASFVIAGAFAKKLLAYQGIKVGGYARSIGKIIDNTSYSISDLNFPANYTGIVDEKLSNKAREAILDAKSKRDSIGGTVTCMVEGLPAGIGNNLFGSLESKLSSAIFAIPGIRGIEFGLGFSASTLTGSEHNDPYIIENGKISCTSNNAGGIVGGISTGMPIKFTCAVKPPSTIGKLQKTVDIQKKENISVEFSGYHDPCIVPRIIPVIESLTAIVFVEVLMDNGTISKKIGKN